jgi:hypothetical protein
VNAARQLRRIRTAAQTVGDPLAYRCLSGSIAADVKAGRLVRTGDALGRFGGADLPDGQQAWYGRHVAKAYRAQHGGDAVKVWAQHRTTSKWIHVHAYTPNHPALVQGLRAYKATRHLADPARYDAAA